MEHLIELRSRLIKALLAFAVAFIGCFFFAKHDLQRADLAVRVGRRAGEFEVHLHRRCSNISSSSSSSRCSARRSCRSRSSPTQIYMFVAPGLYRHERQAFLPYLVATPIFFALGSLVVYFLVMADAGALLARHAAESPARARRRSSCCPRSTNTST